MQVYANGFANYPDAQTPSPPTADIQCNTADSCSISYDTSATISWTSTKTSSCTVTPPGWTGTSGSRSTGNLRASQTYTANCSGPGGSASDSVVVTVNPPPEAGYVNLNFVVRDACDNSAISGALVTISRDFGNGRTRTTDGNGFANFGVPRNTYPIGFDILADGYYGFGMSDYGVDNSDVTFNKSLTRINGCGSDPPPPPPPPGLTCTPASQAVNADAQAFFTASGGNGSYSWSAPGGSPSSGNGANFSTRYASAGSRTVTVSSGGTSRNCAVTVAATPVACIDGSLVRQGGGAWGGPGGTLPTTFSPGQQFSFTMHVRNTVEPNSDATLWWNNAYRLRDLSLFTSSNTSNGVAPYRNSPTDGNTSYWRGTVPVNENFNPVYTLTAPMAPGTYTLRMQMIHNSGWEYRTSQTDEQCGEPPNVDLQFGQIFQHTFTVPAPLPTADIKANGSDNPPPIAYDTSATISWTSQNATSCTVTPPNWTGTSNPNQPSGNLTSPQTYTLNCSGPGGTASDSVTVTLGSSPPTADIKANGSDNPPPIAYDTSVTISWTSQNATSCTVTPPGWTGTSNPNQPSGNLRSPQVYMLNCSGPGGNDFDSVIVLVQPPSPLPAPTNLQVSNTVCRELTLTWTDNASDENAYVIYRGTTSGNLSELTRVPANRTSYTDTPPQINQTYYYQVAAYRNSGDTYSSRSNQSSAFNRPCEANLNNSSHILSIPSSPNDLADASTATFLITINNAAVATAAASILYIDDTFTANLTNPQVVGTTGVACSNPCISGNRLNITGTVNPGSNATVRVRFDINAETSEQLESLSTTARIYYQDVGGDGTTKIVTKIAGPYLFQVAQPRVPRFREVAP